MTTQNSNARPFNPIFAAAVTPASVSTRTAKNGNRYAFMAGATVEMKGKNPIQATVMAFGAQRDEVAKLLRKGKRVELALQRDGGTFRVIGVAHAKAA